MEEIFIIFKNQENTRYVSTWEEACQYCSDYVKVKGIKNFSVTGNNMNGNKYVYLTSSGEESYSYIVEIGRFEVSSQKKEQLFKQNVTDPIFVHYCDNQEKELKRQEHELSELRKRMTEKQY
jgi:hypothetical protein